MQRSRKMSRSPPINVSVSVSSRTKNQTSRSRSREKWEGLGLVSNWKSNVSVSSRASGSRLHPWFMGLH